MPRQRHIAANFFEGLPSLAVTAHKSLILGARPFPGNPYDGEALAEQLQQTAILTDTPMKTALVDLGYRGREVDGTRILHRGKSKRISKAEKRLLKRRQAVEPSIGHLKADHRMRRNFPKGAQGDAMNPILAAAGFNIRWLIDSWWFFAPGIIRRPTANNTDLRR